MRGSRRVLMGTAIAVPIVVVVTGAAAWMNARAGGPATACGDPAGDDDRILRVTP